MKKKHKIILFCSAFSMIFGLWSFAQAQSYRGGYSNTKPPREDPKEKTKPPVPKTFSAHVSSTQQAEKLDIIYDNLRLSLWNYARTDFIYQSNLMEHLRPEKFQYTRHAGEFKGDMENALQNLNDNNKKMKTDIETARADYFVVRDGVRSVDHEVLDKLWDEKMKEFEEASAAFFKMQFDYLNTYRNLVAFILDQGGSYYYKSDERRLMFYKFGGLKYYGKSLDTLRNLSYKQRQLLRKHAPAGVEDDL